MTKTIHKESDSKGSFRTVGAFELLNEPIQNNSNADTIKIYYPNAVDTIRAVEKNLTVPASRSLTAITMDARWGSGDASGSLANKGSIAYDNHAYLASKPGISSDPQRAPTQDEYIKAACTLDVSTDGNSPKFVGEFALTVNSTEQNDDNFKPIAANVGFYKKYFAAQQQSAEKHTLGWIMWTWKTQLGGYRWSYSDALNASVIPQDLSVSLKTGTDLCKQQS